MKFAAAYLLLQMGGNKDPQVGDIERVISTVREVTIEDRVRIEKLIGLLKGKDMKEVMRIGQEQLIVATQPHVKQEEKKEILEETKEEEEVEGETDDDDFPMMNLFGNGSDSDTDDDSD